MDVVSLMSVPHFKLHVRPGYCQMSKQFRQYRKNTNGVNASSSAFDNNISDRDRSVGFAIIILFNNSE